MNADKRYETRVFVAICETEVYGVKAWHCRCLCCGLESQRYDRHSQAMEWAKRHGTACEKPQIKDVEKEHQHVEARAI